jgi:hypothetical protein
MSNVSKRNKNKKNRGFSLMFAERLYTGAPRCFDHKWNKHQRQVGGDKGGTLNREQVVRKMLRKSHDWRVLFDQDKMAYLWTCVNPTCDKRNQHLWRPGHIRSHRNTDGVRQLLYSALGDLARGETGKHQCKSCYESLQPCAATDVKNKWIYVLKQAGKSLSHYREIEITDSHTKGYVASRLSSGRYSNRGRQKWDGLFTLPKNADRYTWHFFLSPLRLGKESLALLKDSPSQQSKVHQALDKSKADANGVVVDKKAQPWATTVARKFSKRTLKEKAFEVVPIVDPFVWVAQALDFDYVLALATQNTLVQNKNEQSKAFIAATLKQAIGRKVTSDNPPAWTETDKWDIKNDTRSVPYAAKGANIAEAWLKRYEAALEYLAEETNNACARVTYVLRYSLAHRIVELGCQEGKQKPRHLVLALMHWAHILREVPVCNMGSHFVRWLTKPGGDTGSPMDAQHRVPRKNVMEGDQIKGKTRLAKEATGLPLLVLHSLCGAIMARAGDPQKALKKHLDNVNVPATITVSAGGSVLTLDKLQSVKNVSIKITEGVLGNYIEKMPAEVDFKTAQKYAVASGWRDRLRAFDSLKTFEDLVGVLTAISDYSKGKRKYGTWTDEYSRTLGKVKAPVAVAEFLAGNTQKLLKYNIEGTTKVAIDKIEKGGTRAIAALSTAEYEAFIGSRSARAYRLVGTGSRILAGPVGLLIGGAEAVAQTSAAFDSYDSGDPGAALGQGIQAAAGVLLIAVAGAECAALLSGAAAASWAGPLGWIAAALMLIGAIIVSVWKKNDLELFASHCFLGSRYGKDTGKSGKNWMEGKRWNHLSQGSDSYQRQRLALTRLMSGFRTWIGATWGTGDLAKDIVHINQGGYVCLGFMPENACFEVKVDLFRKGGKSPEETVHLYAWPRQKEFVLKQGKAQIDWRATFFNVRARPQKIKGGVEWDLKVRLVLDAKKKVYLPASGKYVSNQKRPSVKYSGTYNNALSDDQE